MAQTLNSSFFLLLLLLLLFNKIVPSASKVYNIAKFGAKSDLRTGLMERRLQFQRAIHRACAEREVPVSHATFTGPCKRKKITVQIDRELVAPIDYASMVKKGDWMPFDGVNGVRGGTINRRDMNLWSCKAMARHCPDGATSLFGNCSHILISSLASLNCELYHIVFNGCHGGIVRDVRTGAPGNSPNTDGIHIQMSTGVTITGTEIKTGDDGISVGSVTTDLRA